MKRHDVIAQTLVGINVHLVALAQSDAGESRSLQAKILRTQRIVEKAVEIVHRFACELRPTVLDDLGLIPALSAHLKCFMNDTGIRASLKVFAGIENTPSSVRTALYRIAQEALTNVSRHAQASQVSVSIEETGRSICMEITDDGRGFQVDKPSHLGEKSHLGLLGMQERIEMIHGSFEVDSAPCQSTTIRVKIPLHASRAKKPSVKKTT